MGVPPSDVDLPQARAFLAARLGPDVTDVELIGDGDWSRCFGFEHRGSELVIRFGRHAEDFRRDRFAAQFAAPDLPIPKVTEMGEAFGTSYAISTRALGTPWEQLDAATWAGTLPAIFATLDALRTADISATAGFGGWGDGGDAPHPSWRAFLSTVDDDPPGHRTHGWRQRLLDSPVGDRSFRQAHARMLELAAAFPGERSLVHNDLLNRNALAAEGHVTAVLDWGCSIYGDFVYDLATLVFWSPWHMAIGASDPLGRAKAHYASIGLDVPDLDARLRCCSLHIGLEHLGYNAFLGDIEALRRVEARLDDFLG
jgi:hygromycin-B 4-O-kinase